VAQFEKQKMAVILRDFSPEGPCAHRTGCGQTAYAFRADVSRAQHDARVLSESEPLPGFIASGIAASNKLH
jgi:hypothetical protein